VNKIRSDFDGAVLGWPDFEEWRFVTNARTGPDVAALLTELQRSWGTESERHIRVRLWTPMTLWDEVISKLDQDQLDRVYPGRPGLARVELSDLEPLLDALGATSPPDEEAAAIREVPPNKMDYNQLSGGTRLELNSGRRLATRIDSWYEEQGDPGLSDRHGARFSQICQDQTAHHSDPSEIMEGMYHSLAGSGFRLDSKLANSVYTVTSYFFDQCHIFETPPEEAGDTDAATN
jgi:hypothetical protein